MKAKKGISEMFGALLVTLITLALAVPLFIYFNSLRSTNSQAIGSSFNKLNGALSTEFTVITLNYTPNKIYLYNYGDTPIYITQLIVNKQVISVNYELKANQIVPLSNITSNLPSNLANATVIMKANGNYYTIIG